MPTRLKLLATFAAAMFLAACTAECVDKFDCNALIATDKNFAKKFPGEANPDGGPVIPAQVTCVQAKCVVGDPGGNTPDAGQADGG
jgi:hypothetical protein